MGLLGVFLRLSAGDEVNLPQRLQREARKEHSGIRVLLYDLLSRPRDLKKRDVMKQQIPNFSLG